MARSFVFSTPSIRQAGTGVNHRICEDGIDNDGDGLTDFPADPGCSAVFPDASEVNGACGLGFEIVFLLPPLIALRGAVQRRRGRALGGAARAVSSHTPEETSRC